MSTSPLALTHAGRSTRPPAPTAWTAVGWSLLAAALGLWWFAEPGGYPYAPGGHSYGVLRHVPPDAACLALVVLGGIGAVAAALQAVRKTTASRVFVLLAAACAVLFGLVVPDTQLLIVLAYILGLSLPLALLAGLAMSIRTLRGAIAAAVGVTAVALAGVLSGTTDPGTLGSFLRGIAHGFATNVGFRPFALLFFVAGGVIWAGLAVLAHRQRARQCVRCGRPGAPWTTPATAARWGRPVTYAAAACALPYGLLRMTWLTPWPQGAAGVDLAAAPDIRLMGLLLGSAAIGGFALTLGLVRPWGEIWPRWAPRLRGGRVPVAAGVVPGAVVSQLLFVAGLSLTPSLIATGAYEYLLFFPFLLWAPLLAAATLAYYLRRRADCPLPHDDGVPRGGETS